MVRTILSSLYHKTFSNSIGRATRPVDIPVASAPERLCATRALGSWLIGSKWQGRARAPLEDPTLPLRSDAAPCALFDWREVVRTILSSLYHKTFSNSIGRATRPVDIPVASAPERLCATRALGSWLIGSSTLAHQASRHQASRLSDSPSI